MAISVRGNGAGLGARRGGPRLGARAPVRAGAAVDTAVLALCVIGAFVLLFLPDAQRNAAAATLRRTAVAPLVQLQREAEVRRARYLSYDERVRTRGALARDAADVTGLRTENAGLRRMLGLAARLQWGFVASEAVPNQVVGELVRRPIPLTFLLTVGTHAGVTPFSPVVAADGLVGMVEQVDASTSVAISYANPDFRVSVQTPDGTAFGIVQPHLGSGADRGLLEIRGVPFRSPMKAGQLVVSYGQGGTYPRGVPVGTVIRELQTPEQWARTYLIQPSVSLGDVGAVFVLMKARAVAGVDSVWTTVASADSAARRVAAAGDSLARDILLRESAARRAALDSARGDSAARDTASAISGAPVTAVPPVPGAVRPATPADTASAPAAGASGAANAPGNAVAVPGASSSSTPAPIARPPAARPSVARPTVPTPDAAAAGNSATSSRSATPRGAPRRARARRAPRAAPHRTPRQPPRGRRRPARHRAWRHGAPRGAAADRTGAGHHDVRRHHAAEDVAAMTPWQGVRLAVALAVVVLLHFTLRPLLGGRAPIDFLLIAVMLAAVRLRPGVAAVLGLALGLAADSLSPATFGSGGLALTLVAYGASYLKAVYFADNAALSALFVFAGKWIFDIVSVVSARSMRGTELLVQLLLWSPLAATLTALTALVLFFALRPLIGRAAA